MFITSLAVLIGLVVPGFGQTDWSTYGHDAASTRHSPLKQINTGNVSKLVRAWTYHMSPQAEPASGRATWWRWPKVRGDSDRRRRNNVSSDAQQSSRCDRSRDRKGNLELRDCRG